MRHPKWVLKFIHKSKIHAVKIVTWEEHHEIATVPHVYEWNGEKSEGAKAAQLIASAPELLEALKDVLQAYNGCQCGCDPDDTWHKAASIIAKATE